MGKRKYEAIQGYWVYSIYVPSVNKYYIGTSKRQCCQRWQKSQYKSTILNQYLNEWDSMTKTVLVDGLTKEQAYQYEDNIIQALKMNDLCINERRSGLIRVNDVNAYMKQYQKQWKLDNPEYQKEYHKQYHETNPEYKKQYNKQYYEKNKEQTKQRVKKWRSKKKLEQQNSLPLT